MTPTLHERFEDLTASLVAGKYRIVRDIARGSMGVVFEAEQVPLGRTVALKVLDPRAEMVRADEDTEGSIGPTDRFIREASSAARLSHPNIATIFDYGEWHAPVSGRVIRFIAMEFVPGKPLSEFITLGEPMPIAEAVGIVSQVLEALGAAHAQGIVHRDLKPSNVIVTEDGKAKVVDFGLAKRLDDSRELETQAGLIMGTPAYMAPEQLLGHEPSPQTDLYSATCLLARLVTGKPVYKGATSVETMSMHITAECPAFAELPPELRKVLRRGLAKRPEDRFGSASEFRAALMALVAPRVAPPLPPKRSGPPAMLLAGGVIVVLLLLGGAVLLAMGAGRSTPTAATEEVAPPPAPAPVVEVPDTTVAEEVVEPPPTFVLTSTPDTAEVLDGEDVLCTTPCELEFTGERQLTLRASGYDDRAYVVAAEGNHAIALSKTVTRSRPRARTRRAPSPVASVSPTPAPPVEPVVEAAPPAPPEPAVSGVTSDAGGFDMQVEEIKNPFE